MTSPIVKTGDIVEGRYRIIKTLDEGGMGTVLLAEHVLIKRKVAIKILRPELATDPEVIEHFMHEASAAGTLGHPNIVESTDVGFTRNDVPFIVFEYLEGTLLTDAIYKSRGMTVRRALRIATQIASALDAAHKAGIVHRDLKSDNIFLINRDDAVDHVKVLDFGVSRFLEADDDSRRRKTIVGTPEFMAPEQIMAPDLVDRRTDIYALGVVLYEMLTARRPFKDEGDTAALLHRIVHDLPPPISCADAPAGLQEMILHQLLAKDPARRYQSMKEVQAAIGAFSGVLRPSRPPAAFRDPTPVPAPVEASARPARVASPAPIAPEVHPARRPSLLWLALTVLLAGGGAATLAIGRDRTTTRNDAAVAALHAEADKLAVALEATASAARLRGEGIASLPMLRAAIETDTETLRDMIRDSDFVLAPTKDEVVEVYQLRDGAPVPMLRIPETGRPIPAGAGARVRFSADDHGLVAIASVPIARQNGAVAGALAIAAPVDLGATRRGLADHVLRASLVGFEVPIMLVPGQAQAAGTDVRVPVKISRDFNADLALVGVIAPPVTRLEPDRFAPLRVAAWVLGGLMFGIYLVLLLRARR